MTEQTMAQKVIGDIAPALADYTDRMLFGEVWKKPDLSPRDRSLVTIAALVALQRNEQLETHIGLGLQNGLGKDEIIEAITHLAFYAGWPAAVASVGVARKAFPPPSPSRKP